MKVLAAATLLLALSCQAHSADACPVEVRILPEGIAIDGSRCTASLGVFWQAVQSRLPATIPPGIRWISVIGPRGQDHRSALSAAWDVACQRKQQPAAAFSQAYRNLPASRVLAPSLKRLRPIVSNVDNFYPLRPSKGPQAIRSPNCRFELLPPVIYYRLQAPNNSFMPNPRRESA